MSATELIKQVAALPPREKTTFAQLFHAMENGVPLPTATAAGPEQWPDFGERLRRSYGARVVPDSQSIIDEDRGDR